ncbi:DUF262 domain-containing protein [Massilia oculi]|uniref:DUF262 domain-containing protein n=1 Tax=Massilia oculi TaxID=945844 RepID=UPI001AAF782D|nr:DUF262 domain-containing protein [Massilia oculi]
MAKSSSSLADILFPGSYEQQEFAEGILSIPPEQRKLHTETYDFTVDTVVERLQDHTIFIPEFQRKYVWKDAQASRLIESLIIQCPIPVIYLNQEHDERLAVIDGNQRLTSISRYLNNEFPLKGLTAYPELEGLRFHQLDLRFQRHIRNRTLRCIVILKDTHPQVKFDVFERLNTGAVKLTPQELRHGIYFGDLITLATEVAEETKFAQTLDIKDDKRMKAEELILRFWALSNKYDVYRKPLAGFINSYAEENRHLDDSQKYNLRHSFVSTLAQVRYIFEDLAFKIYDENGFVDSKFNSALFDAEMLAAYQVVADSKAKFRDGEFIVPGLVSLLKSSESFRKSISIATSDENQLKIRVNAMKTLFTA